MPELEEPIKSPSTSMPASATEPAGMEGASQEAPEFKTTAGGGGTSPEEEIIEG